MQGPVRGHHRNVRLSRLLANYFGVPQQEGPDRNIEILNYLVAKKYPGIKFTGDEQTTKEHTD